MNETSYLLLWLEGPLQSWGHDSRFYRRDTLDFPTKSGVLGLLCCALGAGGTQIDWLSKMTPLTHEIISFSKFDQANVRLVDFHAIGSGYDKKHPFENWMIPKLPNGKNKIESTKLVYKHYLQDSVFAAIVEIPFGESECLSSALKNPVWDLCLGRKNCAPSEIIYRGTFNCKKDAICEAFKIANEKSYKPKFLVKENRQTDFSDCDYEGFSLNLVESNEITLNDVPLQFGTEKKYAQRIVTVMDYE